MNYKGKRKRALAAGLVLCLVLGCCGVTLAGDSIVPDMNFVGEPIALSLEEAVKIMQTTGSAAETARLNRDSDKAVAEGYSENARSLKEALDGINAMAGMPGITTVVATAQNSRITTTNLEITRLQRDFAASVLDTNFQAEMNQIESQTVQIYSALLQARENLQVSLDNLKVQKDILSNVKKKYDAGVAAKVDVMMAETAVITAENSSASAETAYKTAKMNFNYLLGYDVMQEVELTDELVPATPPDMTLTEAIQSAWANRSELKGVAFAAEIQDILLKSLEVKYPKNSATYLTQKVAYEKQAKMAREMPAYIEMDIRTQYMGLEDAKRAISAAETTLSNAQEAYRIAMITYDAGMNTLADVQEAQVRSYQAGQAVTAAITAYNLAVCDYRHSIGVGASRLNF